MLLSVHPTFPSLRPPTHQMQPQRLGCKAGTRYRLEADARTGGWLPANCRLLLTEGEELRVLGMHQPAPLAPAWKRLPGLCKAIDALPVCPVPAGAVAQWENKLEALLVPAAQSGSGAAARQAQHYPLSHADSAPLLPLEREMHEELQRSWQAHHRTVAAAQVEPNCQQSIEAIQVGSRVEWYIAQIDHKNGPCGCHTTLPVWAFLLCRWRWLLPGQRWKPICSPTCAVCPSMWAHWVRASGELPLVWVGKFGGPCCKHHVARWRANVLCSHLHGTM